MLLSVLLFRYVIFSYQLLWPPHLTVWWPYWFLNNSIFLCISQCFSTKISIFTRFWSCWSYSNLGLKKGRFQWFWCSFYPSAQIGLVGYCRCIFRTFRRKPLGQIIQYFVGMMVQGVTPSLSIGVLIRFLDWPPGGINWKYSIIYRFLAQLTKSSELVKWFQWWPCVIPSIHPSIHPSSTWVAHFVTVQPRAHPVKVKGKGPPPPSVLHLCKTPLHTFRSHA
jgi:hypothetical protein